MLNEQSYDLKTAAQGVKNRMWWKNKKVMIGIILLVLVVIGVILLITLA